MVQTEPAGKWEFKNVQVDIEYRLVEGICTDWCWFGICYWVTLHLSLGWFCVHKPVCNALLLNFDALQMLIIDLWIFFYVQIMLRSVNNRKSLSSKSNQSLLLISVVATLYCMWCAFQIYLRDPPRPAIGEEADLGVIIFLTIYFFLPHGFCILSMNQKELVQASNQLPL